MADLTFGLVGLATLPFVFFFFATRLTGILSNFRIILNGFGLISAIIFLAEIARIDSDIYNQVWALNIGIIALLILYLWVEVLNIIRIAMAQFKMR